MAEWLEPLLFLSVWKTSRPAVLLQAAGEQEATGLWSETFLAISRSSPEYVLIRHRTASPFAWN